MPTLEDWVAACLSSFTSAHSLPTSNFLFSQSLSVNLPFVPGPLALHIPDLLGATTASPYSVPVPGLPAQPLLTSQDPGQGDLCVVMPSLTP